MSPDQAAECSSLQWLLSHHDAKLDQRERMVADLPLEAGSDLLDIGCGPGLWTEMLADQLDPSASIVGLDILTENLEHAVSETDGDGAGPPRLFVEGDFFTLPFEDSRFDAVFTSNCFVYVRRPRTLLDEMIRVAKPGGLVISRHFDNTFFHLNPVDLGLHFSMMAAISRALQEQSAHDHFDNSFGQKMNGLFRSADLRDVETTTYPVQMVSPLTPDQKTYLMGTAKWYADKAREVAGEETTRRWLAHFDPDAPDYVLDRPDFYLCMFDMTTVGYL